MINLILHTFFLDQAIEDCLKLTKEKVLRFIQKRLWSLSLPFAKTHFKFFCVYV